MKYARDDIRIYTDLHPIDRNDPDSEGSAIEYSLPMRFSNKAQACWKYFSGAAYLFEYKGRLVMTDESLYLTEHGDGSHEAFCQVLFGVIDAQSRRKRESAKRKGSALCVFSLRVRAAASS